MKGLILVLCFLFTACLDSGETLKIGVTPNYSPFEFKNQQGEIDGFDIEFVKELAKRLNLKIKWVSDYDFNGLIPALLDRKIDVIASSLSITPDRLELIAFTEPYYFSKTTYLKRKDNTNLSNKTDLVGKKVGVRKGSLQEQELKKNSKITIISLEEVEKLFKKLNQGKIDALVVDNSIVMEQVGLYQNIVAFYYENDGSDGYGLGLRKNDKSLLARLNAELINMQKDETLQKLIDKYNLP